MRANAKGKTTVVGAPVGGLAESVQIMENAAEMRVIVRAFDAGDAAEQAEGRAEAMGWDVDQVVVRAAMGGCVFLVVVRGIPGVRPSRRRLVDGSFTGWAA